MRPPRFVSITRKEKHMALYAIDYDLVKPGRNYESLFEAIKSFHDNVHVLESSWIVESSSTAAEVRDVLVRHIDANDKLIVKKLTGDMAWCRLPAGVAEWLLRKAKHARV
jgi:hypothetical protein